MDRDCWQSKLQHKYIGDKLRQLFSQRTDYVCKLSSSYLFGEAPRRISHAGKACYRLFFTYTQWLLWFIGYWKHCQCVSDFIDSVHSGFLTHQQFVLFYLITYSNDHVLVLSLQGGAVSLFSTKLRQSTGIVWVASWARPVSTHTHRHVLKYTLCEGKTSRIVSLGTCGCEGLWFM